MSSPPISVIVPVFNAASFIAAALDSISAQELQPREIIVVDDGSTDGSGDVAHEWQKRAGLGVETRILKQANGGPAVARNAGLKMAKGDFIAFLDADDLWPLGTLQRQWEVWRTTGNSKKQSIVMGLTRLFVAKEGEDNVFQEAPFRFLNVGSAFFPARAFEDCGYFDSSLRASEDVDWFLRARDSGFESHAHEAVTLWHRRHPNNMTRGQSLQNLDFHSALKRSLDRRRASGQTSASAPFRATLGNTPN